MADRYWVGGTATWNGTADTKWATTDGGTGGASVPTTADDVFFTNLSTGTCSIGGGNTGAKSINCTGFTGTIDGSSAITVAGSITLVAGMSWGHGSIVTITGTGTLTTAGKTFSGVTVNGAGITVTLGDALTVRSPQALVVTQGTLDTANYSVTCNNFNSSGAGVRTVTLGSSTFTIATAVNFSTSTNLTFNSNTSQLNFTSASGTLQGGSQTFYNVSFTSTSRGSRSITGTNTFNNLTCTASSDGPVTYLVLSGNQTVNGTLTFTGASANQRAGIFSDTQGTSRTITVASASLADCNFRDITIAGAASPISPTRAGDCGGNSGITFPAAKTAYRVGTNTSWVGVSSWALTSGGTGSNDNFPLPQDTAEINNDTTLTGTLNTGDSFRNVTVSSIDCTNRTTAITIQFANCAFYGSLAFSSSVTTGFGSGSVNLIHGRGANTITSNGITLNFNIDLDSFGGSLTLQDALTVNSDVNVTRGTFNANNYNLTCNRFSTANTNVRTITMGSGLWTVTGTGTAVSSVWSFGLSTSNLTFNKDTANILFSNTTTTAREFRGAGQSFNKLTIGGATGTSVTTITGTNNFTELASTKTVAHTIRFTNNQGTIGTWSVTGTSGNVVTVDSSAAGTQRTLTITNKTIDIDYLSVTDINSTNLNPVTFYAGANSTNGGNNTGVAFIARTTASPQNAHILTSGTTFTVPSDWNSSNNNIYLIGAGGGGARGVFSNNTRAAGGGGGGGAFTQLTNFTATPSSSVTYAIGTSGNEVNGSATTWDSGAYIANGGLRGTSSTTGPASAGGTGGTVQTVSGIITAAYAGGDGAAGTLGTAASTGYGSGGGGGAGGPNGAGGNGGTGFASTTQANVAGGGGGGNGGGSNGGNAASATFGIGGNNFNGTGGGATANANGTFGGGGAGGVNTGLGGNGGSGIDILNTLGGAGGEGGSAISDTNTNTGLYGGGGGGGTVSTAGINRLGGSGSQGVIFIVYSTGSAPAVNSNFFLLF